MLAKDGAAHEAFLKDLGKTESGLSTYYRSLVFTGKGSMPKICATGRGGHRVRVEDQGRHRLRVGGGQRGRHQDAGRQVRPRWTA